MIEIEFIGFALGLMLGMFVIIISLWIFMMLNLIISAIKELNSQSKSKANRSRK